MKLPTIVAILLVALTAACSKKQDKAEAASKPPEPVAVRVASAELRKVDQITAVTGSLLPDETVNVSSEVPGRISGMHVDFGQAVRRGQVLAELDKQELSLQVDRSRAALAQALARIGLDPNQENVKPESTPSIRQATAQMEDARSKFENAGKLVKTGDIAQERYTELEKSYRSRQAALEAARDEVRTQLASIQALQAEVKLAQKRLSDATIRAPFDGAVSAKLASVGQYMKENTPIFTVIKTTPIRLRVDIPEGAAGAVRVGTTLTFTTDAAPGVEFGAVVREMNPSLDAKSRSLSVEARLARNDQRLRPGMFVQVNLVLAKGQEVVAVPKDAIYTVAGLSKVYVARGGKAEERKVTPGRDLGNGLVEIPRDQLNPGDQVITTGFAQLFNGAPVRTS